MRLRGYLTGIAIYGSLSLNSEKLSGALRAVDANAQRGALAAKRHCGAIVPYGSAAALPPQGERIARRRLPMEIDTPAPRCPPNPVAIGYTLIRHTGFVLDELSAQGLELWQDERRRWRWRWIGTDLQSARGFWAMGEALVDAVVIRFPAVFDTQALI